MTDPELYDYIRKLSLEEREVTLASGAKSNVYLDLKNVLLHPDASGWIVAALHPILESIRPNALAGEGLGGYAMATNLMAASWDWAQDGNPALFIRKEPKGHGTGAWIEGTKNVPIGAEVVLAEDVVTTGGSVIRAVDRLRDHGYNVGHVLAVVEREEGGGRYNLSQLGVKLHTIFTLEDLLQK